MKITQNYLTEKNPNYMALAKFKVWVWYFFIEFGTGYSLTWLYHNAMSFSRRIHLRSPKGKEFDYLALTTCSRISQYPLRNICYARQKLSQWKAFLLPEYH